MGRRSPGPVPKQSWRRTRKTRHFAREVRLIGIPVRRGDIGERAIGIGKSGITQHGIQAMQRQPAFRRDAGFHGEPAP